MDDMDGNMIEKKMMDALNEPIYPSWNPKDGEVLVGRVLKRKIGVGQYKKMLYIIEKFGELPIHVLEDGDVFDVKTGIFSVWGSVGLDKIMEMVADDSVLAIKFLGKIKTKSGQRANSYSVVDKNGQRIRYDEDAGVDTAVHFDI